MIKKELTPLEAFKRIKNHCEKELIINVLYDYEKELRTVKKALKEKEQDQNKLKALEIINEKEVNIHHFKEFIINQDWNYEDYLSEENDPNTSGHQFAYKLLTQEDFDTLKEVLL